MTDADLIYNACLRAEKALEARSEKFAKAYLERALDHGQMGIRPLVEACASLCAIRTLREAIGSIMAEERR